MIALTLISGLLALLLTPLSRRVFDALGILDTPDRSRKIHSQPIPRGGGLAIALSYILSFFIASRWLGISLGQMSLFWKILPAACIIFAVGIADDLWNLKPWQKLAGQMVAAGVVCSGGFLSGLPDAWWAIPAAMFWLLACCNGFNLIDGMDGLAAGAGIFGALAIAVEALLSGHMGLAIAALPLAGCLTGFLCFNFSPATIFLGDSGSLLIGFLLGCFGIAGLERSATPLELTVPAIALALPLADAALAIIRRFLAGQPILMGDRGHIHHRLLDRVRSSKKAALLLYGVCGFAAVFSVMQSAVESLAVSATILAVFCVTAGVGAGYLGFGRGPTALREVHITDSARGGSGTSAAGEYSGHGAAPGTYAHADCG